MNENINIGAVNCTCDQKGLLPCPTHPNGNYGNAQGNVADQQTWSTPWQTWPTSYPGIWNPPVQPQCCKSCCRCSCHTHVQGQWWGSHTP